MQTEENKKIMARNIKRYMDQKGVTNQQLCEDLGFKYTTFLDWIKAVTYPRIGKIEAMADYFGILKSDLIEEKQEEEKPANTDGLTENQRELIAFAKTLSEEQAGKVLQLMKSILAFDE
ncbi:MAG: helix-turn-helix transcriptional regulator [Bacteroidaceae bacterium]|nr:helix-turn-helix transcriptional regulator [Bacteroidaceae bacterium]